MLEFKDSAGTELRIDCCGHLITQSEVSSFKTLSSSRCSSSRRLLALRPSRWSHSSGRQWPLHLSDSERRAKLASPAPSLPAAPDPDPDPDSERGGVHEEQYVSEGETSQLDSDQPPPDCRDAETITGGFDSEGFNSRNIKAAGFQHLT